MIVLAIYTLNIFHPGALLDGSSIYENRGHVLEAMDGKEGGDKLKGSRGSEDEV